MKQDTDKVVAGLNSCKDYQEYHRLLFELYEHGYNFTNHWHTINSSETVTEFFNSIRWSINVELHDEAIRLAEKALSAKRWKNSSVNELQEKDALHYFKKEYKLKLRLLKHLRGGNLETFCNTHQHYVDVLHSSFNKPS